MFIIVLSLLFILHGIKLCLHLCWLPLEQMLCWARSQCKG